MKYMIASDIHGSAYYCRRLLERFEEEKAGRLVLLGDILYHGPRNDLPREYCPKEVIALLNQYKGRILAVRGNCDTEVDQMVLEFPIMAEYAVIDTGKVLVYLTHGHKLGPAELQPATGNLLLCGHTHVPACEDHGTYTYLNPGSVSIPKNGSPNSYMILEDGTFAWKDLDGNTYRTYSR